jgi:hypothetical protein
MSFFKSIKLYLGLENEMPEYEVLKTLAENIEIRKYPATKWVSAKMDAKVTQEDVAVERSNLFGKLFKYISGSNSDEQKISMTVPVTINYESKDKEEIVKNSSCEMSMSFYVPPEFNEKTPKPIGENMFIKEIPEMIVAVSRFSGYASVDDYMKHRDLIVQALGPDEAKNFDSVNLMTAGYDAPFQPFFRRNEVWLRKI